MTGNVAFCISFRCMNRIKMRTRISRRERCIDTSDCMRDICERRVLVHLYNSFFFFFFNPFSDIARSKHAQFRTQCRRKFHCLLSLVCSELRCLGIRLVKRPCCYCVGRVVAGGNPRSLARRGRLSRLLQFKHNGGYLYRFQNKKNDKRTEREREEERKTGEKGRA